MTRLKPSARAVVAIVAAMLAVAAVVSAFAVADDSAGRRHAAAVAEHEAAVAVVADRRADLRAAEEAASATAALAGRLAELPAGYADAEDGAELADAAAEVVIGLDEAEAFADAAPAARPIADGSAAELAQDAQRLEDDVVRLRDHASDLETATEALESAAARVDEAGAALVEGIADGAGALDGQHESARNLDRLAFRDAAAVVAAADGWTPGAVEAVEAFVIAADALVASHGAEEAEKAGSLYDRRKEVESFARELANGVLLEFDWTTTVLGYGTGGTYGGSATWDVRGGGIAVITFTDSVAELWDAAGVRALVAHEVGHAMTGRCLGDIVTDELAYVENEAWATAWAISRGYTGDGSGEWVYGRPSDDVVDLAASCR